MVAGRKYYFHQPQVQSLGRNQATNRSPHIQPLGENPRFTFRMSFENVAEDDEWPLLLYALTLEDGVRHKLGYAKPAGLGSVHVEVTWLTLVDPRARYAGTGQARRELAGAELTEYLADKTARYRSAITSRTLNDLRRIWAWPPAAGVVYRYPTQGWFRRYPQVAIADIDKTP